MLASDKYTKNAHWCYISPPRGGAISEAIAMTFCILTDLEFVMKFVKFGYDPLQGQGLVSSHILGFCLHLRSRPYSTVLRDRACCDRDNYILERCKY